MALSPLRAGQMRQVVQIMRAEKVSDGSGGFVSQWSAVAEVRAQVEGIDGREAVIAQALQGVSTYRIRIWALADKPSAPDQIKLADGTDLNIKSCTDPFGNGRELSILADTASAQATS